MRRCALLPVGLLMVLALPGAAVADDVPTCLGQPATVVGTAGDDILKGTDAPDVMWGGAGNDYIYGYEGDDVICLAEPTDPIREVGHDVDNEFAHGGNGDDRIVSGRGLNDVRGAYGSDEIWAITDAQFIAIWPDAYNTFQGGPGDDILHGNEARNAMYGGRGNDTIDVGEGDPGIFDDGVPIEGGNWARGGPGDDTLTGGTARDELIGGRGNDRLVGGPGDDWLYGDSHGHEFDDGWFGDDELLGGAGNDELRGMGGTNRNDGGDGDDGCVSPASDQEGATSCENDLALPQYLLRQ